MAQLQGSTLALPSSWGGVWRTSQRPLPSCPPHFVGRGLENFTETAPLVPSPLRGEGSGELHRDRSPGALPTSWGGVWRTSQRPLRWCPPHFVGRGLENCTETAPLVPSPLRGEGLGELHGDRSPGALPTSWGGVWRTCFRPLPWCSPDRESDKS